MAGDYLTRQEEIARVPFMHSVDPQHQVATLSFISLFMNPTLQISFPSVLLSIRPFVQQEHFNHDQEEIAPWDFDEK
jgi:hypothetical protein